jgi:hypothetical protein
LLQHLEKSNFAEESYCLARASVAPHLVEVLHFSGGCLNGALQARSEFRRTSRLQGAPFLSPVSFGKTKEIGSPPGDSRPRTQVPQQAQDKKHKP